MKTAIYPGNRHSSSLLAGLTLAAGLFANATFGYTTNTVSIGINATDQGAVIPPNFLGLSFGREFISGSGGYDRIFDPTHQTNCPQLTNLLAQIGIKHIRTICGPYDVNTPDPTAAQDDVFFTFCHNSGVTSVIYSLHCYDEPVGSPDDCISANHIVTNSADLSVLESFALDNEPDWLRVINGADPNIHNYSEYKAKWGTVYTNINTYLPQWTPFSGPDTGSEWPALNATDTAIDTNPFTLQFAQDFNPRAFFYAANQHFYNAAAEPASDWVQGSSYWVNDQVMDESEMLGTTPTAYICIQNDGNSQNQPHNASSYWMPVTPLWADNATYPQYDIVEDADNDGNGAFYQDMIGGVSTEHPRNNTARWNVINDPSGPTARQMAIFNLSTNRLSDWSTLYYNALAGTNSWPQKSGTNLAYRLTEVSAYNNGGGYFTGGTVDPDTGNPNGQNFSSALWELDMCHWFARHNCAGVNPMCRPVDYSAPIFNLDGNYVAQPYAYGLKAFDLGGHGTCVNASGVNVTNSNPASLNLTAYAVVNTNDLYVTIIDKTFQTIGAYAAAVTLVKPNGFTPTSASYIVLTSSTSGEGDATALSLATIGGAILPTSGNWSGTWNSLPVSDGSCSLVVQPCTAVIVDLHK